MGNTHLFERPQRSFLRLDTSDSRQSVKTLVGLFDTPLRNGVSCVDGPINTIESPHQRRASQ
jgi:hypothetical protein